jgi:hypothetical protein
MRHSETDNQQLQIKAREDRLTELVGITLRTYPHEESSHYILSKLCSSLLSPLDHHVGLPAVPLAIVLDICALIIRYNTGQRSTQTKQLLFSPHLVYLTEALRSTTEHLRQ